ncbi:MAG TPA: helix-turn-helix transcriptional regulator [Chthoniobacterales bacterium]|nr:helix-turn-helix transcriptional regulator [Chthoniobacterales bacterium]
MASARLSSKDVDRYNAVVQAFYRRVHRRGVVHAAGAAIAALIPGEVIAVSVTRRGVMGEFSFTPGESVGEMRDVSGMTARDHPTMGRRFRQPRSISDVLSVQRWQRTELSDTMRSWYSADDDLGLDTRWEAGTVFNCCVIRRWARTKDRDRAMLAMLRPHFTAAHALTNAYSEIERLQGEDWMRVLGGGIISLDDEGKVLGWSDATRRLVANSFALSSGPLRELPEELSHWVIRQRSSGLVSSSALAICTPLVKRCGGQQVEFYFLHDGALRRDFIVVRPGRGIERANAAPAGLTQREREIVAGAARGLRNMEIAGELGIASSTVKRHLENIYAKLGVRGRIELITRYRDA